MNLDSLLSSIKNNVNSECVITKDKSYTYRDLSEATLRWKNALLSEYSVKKGQVIAIHSDYSFETIALALALFSNKNIVAFISPNNENPQDCLEDAEVSSSFIFSQSDTPSHVRYELEQPAHPLLAQLNACDTAGFIIFSSGTTGRPKAILHDLNRFLSAYHNANKTFRTLAFLLLDHIAGVDTLFYTLFSGGALAISPSRGAEDVCRTIEELQVEVLPVSPSFLNLMLISGHYNEFDLSSLQIISFGSEPANHSLLTRLNSDFEDVKIVQKYGTSEFGSPPSKTRDSDIAWLKMDSEDFQTKVIDDILWVKSASAMLGYLNAEGMVEKDGWLCTGDRVEVRDDWYRIVGRDSDMINVGGEKVFPSEVEAIICEVDNVTDAMVYGETNTLLGNIVCTKVQCAAMSDTSALRKAIRKHCLAKLERFKVPAKFQFTESALTSSRHKKVRIK